MSSCRQSDRWLRAAFAGELGVGERLLWEQHVAECARCQRAQARQSMLLEGLHEFREAPLHRVDIDAFVGRVQSALDAEHPVPQASEARRPWAIWIAVAAGLLLALGLWRFGGEGIPAQTPTVPVVAPTPESHPNGLEVAATETLPLPAIDSPAGDAPRKAKVFGELREEGQPFDDERRAQALAELRTILADLPSTPEAYETRVQALRRAGWPMVAMLGRAARDGQATIASGAVRALAMERGTAARRELWELREQADVGSLAVRLWLQQEGLDPQAASQLYWEAAHRPEVRQAWQRIPSEDLAGFAAALLARAPGDSMDGAFCADLLDLWARDESAGVVWVLDALAAQRLPWDNMLPLLRSVPHWEPVAQAWLTSNQRRSATSLGLELAQRYPSDSWVGWLHNQTHDRRFGAEALACLAQQPGPNCLRALCALRQDPAILETRWLAAWQLAVQADGPRVVAAIRPDSGAPSELTAQAWLEALMLVPGPEAALGVAQCVAEPGLDGYLQSAALAFVAEHGDDRCIEPLQGLFELSSVEDDSLRARILITLGILGGEPAVRAALGVEPLGALDRDQQQVLAWSTDPNPRTRRERGYLIQRRLQRLQPTLASETLE
ncbi:MAG: hypothetical protein H6830_06045 [Planctomycetes bacterium]|nr:hypothetical protein [Planctomycetota bacterium]MCB9909085.1 hypothetical protein [Planctomycetota bacterium]MCB9911668.1 hypothetical protein [Planctomycetota bacterium]